MTKLLYAYRGDALFFLVFDRSFTKHGHFARVEYFCSGILIVMSPFWKTVFQPLANRHYTSRKLSVLNHLFGYLPFLTLSLLGAIFIDAHFLWALPVIALHGAVSYLLFDRVEDKLTWTLFWREQYKGNNFKRSAEHNTMKALEQNPTEANKNALAEQILKQNNHN
jgi:hypothetical protein